ncbi:hypothetical protein I3843_13G153600 [Carya illinoinensis]|nr:hypothetical protein I3843_13G153600 [Carya illinoinensis]
MHELSLTLLACHTFSSSFVAQTRLDRFSMTPLDDHCDQINLCSSLMQFVLVSSWMFPAGDHPVHLIVIGIKNTSGFLLLDC